MSKENFWKAVEHGVEWEAAERRRLIAISLKLMLDEARLWIHNQPDVHNISGEAWVKFRDERVKKEMEK